MTDDRADAAAAAAAAAKVLQSDTFHVVRSRLQCHCSTYDRRQESSGMTKCQWGVSRLDVSIHLPKISSSSLFFDRSVATDAC